MTILVAEVVLKHFTVSNQAAIQCYHGLANLGLKKWKSSGTEYQMHAGQQ